MEEILAHLLVPDNNTIVQATEALRQAFKSPDAIPALCNVLITSQSPQIRQYAAVVLRKRLNKARNWKKLTPDIQNGVKSGILPVLLSEKEKSVKTAVVQFIAVIAKHELVHGGWPDLQKLLQTLISSQTQSDVELGMFIMSVLTDVSLEIFANQSEHFVFLFMKTMDSLDNLNTVLGYYTVITMTHALSVCETDQNLRLIYLKAFPRIMKSVPALIAQDEEKACDVLDFFAEVLATLSQLITPHLIPFIQFCLQLCRDKEMPPTIRDKAFCLLGGVCRVKKKLLVRHNSLKPIVDVLFTTMCEPPEDGEGEDEDFFNDDDIETPSQSATHVLGGLSLYLPPKKLVELVIAHVTVGLQGDDKFVRKASYYALGIITEGASECIRNKHLSIFIQYIRAGITDSSSVVRSAALFALGQVSEHLQPEVSEHAEELMPILFEYLSHLCNRLKNGGKEPQGLYSMFYALEAFCENLEEKLVPYLPMLVERLLLTLEPKYSVSVQELALSTIGAVASAVNTGILPFFEKIIEKLKIYLLEQHTEETACLQVQALETLSILARTLGAEHFGPLTSETVALGLKLLQSSEDPDLKRATYSLFASLSSVMKEQSATFLPILVESLVLSIKSTDGIVYKDDESTFPIYEDLSDTADEEDIEDASEASSDVGEVAVENPYMDEKEEAVITLKDFAANAGTAFLPYLEKCFEEVFKLTSYPYDDVRKSSFETLAQFCVGFSKIDSPEGILALEKALDVLVAKCGDTASNDDEVTVVNAAVEALGILLKEIGAPVIAKSHHLTIILKVVNDILVKKTECQDRDEETEEDDEGEAEQDELLMETAGEIIPHLGKALPAATYIELLQGFLPAIRPKLSKTASSSQRSFFIGTLAECMEPAADELQKRQDLCAELLLIFMSLIHDKQSDVRNNAMFGLGELVLHSKQSLYSQYMNILQSLSTALSQETHGIVIDNICGAIARLVITNVELVPMDQVFPVFLEKLPLREDFEEHKMILRCFAHLYQIGHPSLRNQIAAVIRICCLILIESKGKEELFNMGFEMLVLCRKDFPAELSSVLQSLPPEEASNISSRIPS